MKKPELIMLLTRACQQPLGVKVRSSDPNKLRARLYAVRKNQPEFAHLSFVVPAAEATDTLLIIVKEAPAHGDGEEH